MAAPVKFNVFVGSETGLLKAVNTVSNNFTNVNQINNANKENEIRSICLDSLNPNNIYFGTCSHKILCYNFCENNLTDKFQLEKCKGTLKSVKICKDNAILASDNGVVRIVDKENGEIVEDFSSGDNLCCMVQNIDNVNIIATGGKESDLKIWDVNDTQKCVFEAKNVRNDWLNLRVPIWVLGAQFIPQSDKIVTCTGYHQVRVYDPKVQRRPVLDMTFDEYPITALSLCGFSDNLVIVGNSQGKMGTVDIRMGKIVNIFKGFAGGIRDIKCHKSLPVVASCGLDRYLRIHDCQTKELKNKFYLKSRLNCLLYLDKLDSDVLDQISQQSDSVNANENNDNRNIDENEDEEIWNRMEIVKTKSKRKGQINSNEDAPSKKVEPSIKKKKKK